MRCALRQFRPKTSGAWVFHVFDFRPLRVEGVDLAKGEGRWALLLDALVARGAVGNIAAAARGAHVARRGLAAVRALLEDAIVARGAVGDVVGTAGRAHVARLARLALVVREGRWRRGRRVGRRGRWRWGWRPVIMWRVRVVRVVRMWRVRMWRVRMMRMMPMLPLTPSKHYCCSDCDHMHSHWVDCDTLTHHHNCTRKRRNRITNGAHNFPPPAHLKNLC